VAITPGREKCREKWHGRLLLILGLITLVGCTITQVVPIQLGRVHQIETYKQTFSFLKESYSNSHAVDPLRVQTRLMDQTFKKLLGDDNWQILKDSYGIGNLRNEILDDKIYLRGVTALSIYPDANNADLFSIQGSGRFYLIRDRTDAILMTGDFIIGEQLFSMSDLRQGYLLLRLDLYVSRVPNQLTFFRETPVVYKIFLDTSMEDHGVYSIDYGATHYAYLIDETDFSTGENAFATLKFESLNPKTRNTSKLIDFRGIEFIRRDYDKLHKGTPDE
jgi:hypothetical protein